MKLVGIGLFALTIWASAGGVASAGIWDEAVNGGGDAGNLITTGQITNGLGALTQINGTLPTKQDADLFQINITNEAAFTASTVGLTTVDTRLYLFNSSGFGVTFDDDAGTSAQSTITSQFVTANGLYWLAISAYPLAPNGTNGGFIWNSNPYNVERAPDGPGAAYALASWSGGTTATAGSYGISLTGAEYAVPEPATLGLLALPLVVALRRR